MRADRNIKRAGLLFGRYYPLGGSVTFPVWEKE
jgi:hypothetical protein